MTASSSPREAAAAISSNISCAKCRWSSSFDGQTVNGTRERAASSSAGIASHSASCAGSTERERLPSAMEPNVLDSLGEATDARQEEQRGVRGRPLLLSPPPHVICARRHLVSCQEEVEHV